MRREVSYYIREKKRTASNELAHVLKKCIGQIDRSWKEIIILCIGSDRITGDSLGPLIGQQLSRYRWKNIHIYGTLDAPVHALNLESTLSGIKKRHPSALILAVDASLGSQKHIGYITAGIGPIHPGSGVHKNLPAVGDLYITGILNASGSFEHFLLQTTRLSFVVVYERRGLLPDGWFHREERRDLCWAKEDSGLAALSIETSSGSIS